MKPGLEDAIKHALTKHGWAQLDGTAVAEKAYETAVGRRVAFAYLHGPDSCGVCAIRGSYYSEGRNIMATCGVLFSEEADSTTMAECVARFCASADQVEAQSYPGRLYRLGLRNGV